MIIPRKQASVLKNLLSEENSGVKAKLYDGNVILNCEHAYWKATLVPPTFRPSLLHQPTKLRFQKNFPNSEYGEYSLKELKRSSCWLLIRLSKSSSVKFGNDQVAKIMGYGDYQIGKCYYSRYCLRKPSVASDRLMEMSFLNQTLPVNIMRRLASLMNTVARFTANRVVLLKDENRTLIEAARLCLIYAKAPVFLWAKWFATHCYTQNLFHDTSSSRLKHHTSLFTRTNSDLFVSSWFGATLLPNESIVEFGSQDTRTFMIWTHVTSVQGLVANPPPSTPFVPPSRWMRIFEPKKLQKDVLYSSMLDLKQCKRILHEFERLEVWELVPPPDKAFVITLKWIYKVKLDELGGILKNKARLVARGYRQEEGIDFEESFAPLQD
ncbi:retrovirus-related pol polyprotein from transposon TNT 1-94 [Tanacetum coccineum]|uniref:Retrovirus-related pol polyprotein from transposon TNT 1-94 n=1 Tax=Tanacetum coccineum TaxID=301880 RepID=A0ABQ5A1N2_9ASTR